MALVGSGLVRDVMLIMALLFFTDEELVHIVCLGLSLMDLFHVVMKFVISVMFIVAVIQIICLLRFLSKISLTDGSGLL